MIGLTVGWYGAAKESDWHDDARWIVLAVAAVVVSGLGLLGWVVAGRARLTTARRHVIEALTERQKRRVQPRGTAGVTVTAAGMHRRHRPDCLLMDGKVAIPAAEDDETAGCGVCGT
jgi:hypothetical protein